MVTIKIILGSTRPQRFGIQPAEWMYGLAKKMKGAQFELIDLAKVNLPMLDEPIPALMEKYSKAHTKKWSKIIDEADGFIFVTPEYNHSTSGALKNAIDFLVREWGFKPAAFVSYGADAGGSRAVEHLRQILAWVKVYDLNDHIGIANYWTQLDPKGKFQPTEAQEIAAQKLLSSVVFWSEQMKKARAELKKAK